MVCQDCNKEEAVIHFTQIVQNQKITLNLCKKCASKRGFQTTFPNLSSFSLEHFLGGIAGSEEETGTHPNRVCATCGLSYQQFRETGRLGCGDCYNAFEEELNNILRKIHGAGLHVGKLPEGSDKDLKIKRKIEDLKEKMRVSIEQEEFEKSAKIRDEVKRLEQVLHKYETRKNKQAKEKE